MSANPSRQEPVALEELSQVELLIKQGRLDQAKVLYETKRESYKHPDESARAYLDYLHALILHESLDYSHAVTFALSAFEFFRNTSDNKQIAKLQLLLGKIYLGTGELEEAEQYMRDCLATCRRIRDKAGIFEAYNRLAQIKFIRGEFDASAKFLTDAIDSFKASAREDLNSEITLMRYSGNLARIYILTGEWEQADRLLRRCIEHNREFIISDSLIRNLLSLGYLGIRRREAALCEDCFNEAKGLLETTHLKREEIILYEYLGEYYAEFSRLDQAVSAYTTAIEMSEQLSSQNTLLSQCLRRRAEAYLALAQYEKAALDAARWLEIATQVGEKVEEAACLKVLALTSLKHRLTLDAPDYFPLAEAAFAKLSEKYEAARMHLAFSAVEVESGDLEGLRWNQEQLQQARSLFQTLGADYYLAVADLIEVEQDLQAREFDRALTAIGRAERYFESIGSEGDLRHAFGLRRKVEKALVNFALSDDNEFNLLRTFLNPAEYQDLRRGSLKQCLKMLTDRIRADRAVVGIYDFSQGELKPLASLDFDLKRVEGVKQALKYAGIKPDNQVPFYITSPFDTSNGSAANFAELKDSASSILIPIDIGSEKSAVVYLQRDRGDERAACFGKLDLNLSVAFADVLAFRAIEEEKASLEKDNLRLRAQLEERLAFPNIVTGNPAMLKMLEKVIQVKDSPISILIQGETGCGKDLLAKTIHYNSVRKDKRFISVNCAALPETLLESELFGYKKGAFTGADRDRAGLFEEADGGTFFLDEIGEMPHSIQVKLLRVLEDQEVTRLGDTRGRKVDVRILSATNRDLRKMMEEGRFRQDLYYRLSAMTLQIPSLRERREDVPLLIAHFLAKYDSTVQMDPEVHKALLEYAWPGNVRELDNEIKKLILLAGEEKRITMELLSRKFSREREAAQALDLPNIEKFDQGFTLYDYITMFEKKYIQDALAKHRWVKKHAAGALGIPESTLRLKMREYNISKD